MSSRSSSLTGGSFNVSSGTGRTISATRSRGRAGVGSRRRRRTACPGGLLQPCDGGVRDLPVGLILVALGKDAPVHGGHVARCLHEILGVDKACRARHPHAGTRPAGPAA